MKLLVACMVKNEADRFLLSALSAWNKFADKILVLDDRSEDESVEICYAKGVEVFASIHPDDAWGAETPLRKQLWDKALELTKPGDYIFILDADMVPAKDPRVLLEPEPDAVAFPLFDLWTEYSDGMLEYREDEFWQGHLHPRVWLVRRPEDRKWKWSERGIHSGHFPLNLNAKKFVFAPLDYSLLHYAYVDNSLRSVKLSKYKEVWPQLSKFERAHAASIAEQNPFLKTLHFTPEFRLKKAK